MTVRDDLIAARALIDTEAKWCKGECIDGHYTALRALRKVTAGDFRRYYDARTALEYEIPASVAFVTFFNDHPDTTHADVMALFDRAIAGEPE